MAMIFRKQGEKTTSEWEQIIAIKTTNKGLTSKIYKQLIKLNARKKKTKTYQKV